MGVSNPVTLALYLWLGQYAYVHVHHAHLYSWSALSCYSSTAAFNDCYSELIPYTMLPNSYYVTFHDASQCQGHAYSR